MFKGLKSCIFKKLNFSWKSPYFMVPYHLKKRKMMALRDIEPLVPKFPDFSRLLVSGDNQKQTRRVKSSPERARKGPLLFAPPGPTRRPPAFHRSSPLTESLEQATKFKGNARVEISASFFLFVQPQFASP